MTQNISNLTWLPLAGTRGDWGAFEQVSAQIDQTWIFNCAGATNDQGDNIEVRQLTVENINNNGNVKLTYGPLSFIVPPYSRQTFPVPYGLKSLRVDIDAGTATIMFLQNPAASDAANQLLIQQTAVKTLIYGYVNYNVSVTQSKDDVNKNVLFTPTLADMNYSLLSIGGDGIGNGWFQYVKNLGTKKVTIVPDGGDTINTVYTSVIPIVLYPGDHGFISSDGIVWFFDGKLSFVSDLFSVTTHYTKQFTHNLNCYPLNFVLRGVCKVANGGYVPGDRVAMNLVGTSSTTRIAGMVYNDKMNMSLLIDAGFAFISQGTTNAYALTLSQWDWEFECNNGG